MDFFFFSLFLVSNMFNINSHESELKRKRRGKRRGKRRAKTPNATVKRK